MDEEQDALRLEIVGRWSAADMGALCTSVSELYNMRFLLELMLEEIVDLDAPMYTRRRSLLLRRYPADLWRPLYLPALWDEKLVGKPLEDMLEIEERLDVKRIQYASPGSVDLVGIGAIVGHLKDLVMGLVQRRDMRKQRELADERAALENERLRIENLRQYIGIARDIGYTEAEVRQLMLSVDRKQEPLLRLLNDGKLLGVGADDATRT